MAGARVTPTSSPSHTESNSSPSDHTSHSSAGGSGDPGTSAGAGSRSRTVELRRWNVRGKHGEKPRRSPSEPRNSADAPTRAAKEPQAPRGPAGHTEANSEGESVETGPKAPPLDTLAELDHNQSAKSKEKLAKRAKMKNITVPIAIGLAELRTPLEKSYRNTFYCAGLLVQDRDGKLRGLFCGNRWCLVCSRVRSARGIDRYIPVISAWSDPQFVTLTLPNVQAAELAATIAQMLRDILAIGRAIKRTDKLPLQALRKLECTYNAQVGSYHPHFHLVVGGRKVAEAMVRRWLALHPDASPAAQDIRPCDLNSMKEMFKYFTKLLAKDSGAETRRSVAPLHALDVIFTAIKGKRVFQPMGFKVNVPPAQDDNAEIGQLSGTVSPTRRGEKVAWEWVQGLHDWIDLETGDALSGFEGV